MPSTPFIGVRISWLMLATNSDFSRAASSASSRATTSSCSARRRCDELAEVAGDRRHRRLEVGVARRGRRRRRTRARPGSARRSRSGRRARRGSRAARRTFASSKRGSRLHVRDPHRRALTPTPRRPGPCRARTSSRRRRRRGSPRASPACGDHIASIRSTAVDRASHSAPTSQPQRLADRAGRAAARPPRCSSPRAQHAAGGVLGRGPARGARALGDVAEDDRRADRSARPGAPASPCSRSARRRPSGRGIGSPSTCRVPARRAASRAPASRARGRSTRPISSGQPIIAVRAGLAYDHAALAVGGDDAVADRVAGSRRAGARARRARGASGAARTPRRRTEREQQRAEERLEAAAGSARSARRSRLDPRRRWSRDRRGAARAPRRRAASARSARDLAAQRVDVPRRSPSVVDTASQVPARGSAAPARVRSTAAASGGVPRRAADPSAALLRTRRRRSRATTDVRSSVACATRRWSTSSTASASDHGDREEHRRAGRACHRPPGVHPVGVPASMARINRRYCRFPDYRRQFRASGKRTPVSSSESSHSLRAVSASFAAALRPASVG